MSWSVLLKGKMDPDRPVEIIESKGILVQRSERAAPTDEAICAHPHRGRLLSGLGNHFKELVRTRIIANMSEDRTKRTEMQLALALAQGESISFWVRAGNRLDCIE
jgi:hypothetical protein